MSLNRDFSVFLIYFWKNVHIGLIANLLLVWVFTSIITTITVRSSPQMLAKFAEDDRIEQMNAQKRHMKQQEHKRAVEDLPHLSFVAWKLYL